MKILGLEIRKAENRGLENPDATIISPYSNMGLQFGLFSGQRSATSLSAVYRCVDLISDSIAMLPIHVCDENGETISHSLDLVFSDRDSTLTKYEFVKCLVQSVLLRGNGFAFIERNGDGSVKKLRFVQSSDVTINYDKAKDTLYYSIPTISAKHIESVNVIHLRKYSNDGVNGISVISAADHSLKIAKYSESSAENFYSKGGNLSGIISVQGQLNAQQRKDIINNWTTAYSDGGQGIAVMGGGMTYSPVQVSAADQQLLEVRKYNAVDICRFFGVAPSLIGETSGASYGSIEAEMQSFVLHTLLPFITLIEDEFSRKMLKKSESNFHINFDETFLLKADKSSTASYYSTLVNTGILTRNEARKSLGFSAVDGGDNLVIPYTNTDQNTLKNNTDKND